MKIVTRKAIPSDHPFIYATYIRNRWFDKANKTSLPRSVWSTLQHKRLEVALATQPVTVACLDEDPDVLVGYGFKDSGVLYIYVKLDFRSLGLGVRELLMKEVEK